MQQEPLCPASGSGAANHPWNSSVNSRIQKREIVQIGILKMVRILFLAWLAVLFQGSEAKATELPAWRKSAEPQIRAIYERGEFRGKRIRAEWLPDSSGYVVQERDPKTGQPVRIEYDVRTGKRTRLQDSEDRRTESDRMRSPDGKRILEFRQRSLFVRDLETGQRAQLTKARSGRDIFYREPRWSPDSKRIVFIESDETDVRLRSMLVPSDPSYPGVRTQRFARVGETISSLRIGVVDVATRKTQWLQIETPCRRLLSGAGGLGGQFERGACRKAQSFS